MSTLATVIGGIVVAFVGGMFSLAIAKLTNRTNATIPTVAPYEALARRVGDLEKADEEKGRVIGTLRGHLQVVINDRDTVVSYVRSLVIWFQGGQKPPAPTMPTILAQHLDPGSFDVARVTEVTRSTTTRYAVSEHTTPSPEED